MVVRNQTAMKPKICAVLADVQSQGMYPRGQVAQGGVNGAVPGNAPHRREGRSTDQHRKMAFSRPIIPPMSGVLCAIIDNFQPLWGKSGS